MNHKKTTGSHSPFVFPPNPGFFGAGAQSAPPPPPFAPYLVPAQTPWAGAATMNNVLTPNHPYLQVFLRFLSLFFALFFFVDQSYEKYLPFVKQFYYAFFTRVLSTTTPLRNKLLCQLFRALR